VIALRFPLGDTLLGLVLAFGAGVLLSAVAYELVDEAFGMSGGTGSLAIGLPLGALTFFTGDWVIDRMGGEHRKSPEHPADSESALAIVLGIVLDGIPESIVLGLTLFSPDGLSVAMLAAVFVSNVPESVAATAGLRGGGWRPSRILGLWALVALVSGLAALVGFTVFEDAPPRAVGFVDAFAAGAILTMLADTMMPEAYRRGGKTVGLVTTLGFGVAFAISTLE
jgi:ZIP family zinc transporter